MEMKKFVKNTTNAERVGFVATGSELISGEILNTNGQKMAQALLESGIEIGEHLIVDDDENNMLQSMHM